MKDIGFPHFMYISPQKVVIFVHKMMFFPPQIWFVGVGFIFSTHTSQPDLTVQIYNL